MQTSSASDPSFKAFLEKLQEQNSRGFVTQLVQLKADRENVGKDNDKREEQLDEVVSSLNEVRTAVTGIKLDIDLTPLINIGENQTKLLEELSRENSLTRKLTEGSVEYDKEAAQYRNTSGRDIESKVSGKTSKDGGFIDFETARDTLSGQGKRVREDNAFSLKPINYTPGKAAAAAVGGKEKSPGADEEGLDKPVFKGFLEEIKSGFKFFMTDGLSQVPGYGPFQEPPKDVEKKEKETKVSSPRQENPEADNIASTGEIEADAAKSDLEISKQMLDTTKAQLVELKAIREALAPKTPKDLIKKGPKGTGTPSGNEEGGGGGSLIGDLASGAMDLMGSKGKLGKMGRGLMTAGKAALPHAAAAGVAVAGGAAVDYGLGKLGVGKDKEGNDLKVDTAQDDANWKRMSLGQKVQSGVGRGIEKVGSALFLDNMSREAQADRVKNETEYFKDKDFVDSSSAQDDANWNKMSFGKKILSGINRGGEKLSLFDSTKTTAARIRKETEELNKDAPGAAKTEENVTGGPGAKNPVAVAPMETVDGKKIKPVTDVDKAQQAAKEKYQAAKLEETSASEKLKAFEKENPFDYREKPTATQDFLDMPGTGKFKDPKKQAEYDKVSEAKYQASKSIKSAGAEYTAAEGVTKTYEFTGGASKRGDKSGLISDSKKIEGLKKRGYTDKDLGRDDTLTQNFIQDGDAKYPLSNLGKYEAVVKKELDAPIDVKTKDGQVTPKETIDGKPVAVAARPKSVDEIAMAEAKKYGRDTPNIDDKKFALMKVKTEALKTAGSTEGEFTRGALNQVTPKETIDGKPATVAVQKRGNSGFSSMTQTNPDGTPYTLDQINAVKAEQRAGNAGDALKKASDEDARIYSNAYDNAGGEGLSAAQKKTLANDAVVAARAKRTMEQGSTVAQTSTENADMAREASGRGGANNTVVSNNVSSNNTTKFVPMKASPRPEYTGSSLDRYTNRITVY